MRISYFLSFFFLVVATGCSAEKINHPGVSWKWQIDIVTGDVGKIALLFDIDVYPKGTDSFSIDGYTEKNMDQKVLGFWKAKLGRVAGSNFKEGSLVRFHNVVLHDDSLKGVLVTPFNNFYLSSELRDGMINGILKDGANKTVGIISGHKDPRKIPLDDYPSIINTALNIAEQKLYDPSIVKSKAWSAFSEKMREIGDLTKDDAALVLGFYYYAAKLPFSHFALYRPVDITDTTVSKQESELFLQPMKHIAYLKVSSFSGSAGAMDSILTVVASDNYNALIVDLRDNTGGSIEAGMPFIRHLITDTTYGGIFLTQKYFKMHDTPPPVADYHLFPYFTEANYDLLIEGISEQPAIILKAYPAEPIFRGRIYMLTNKRTASACEPIVYTFKQQKRAVIVGQKTAGAMLNGESFPVGKDYKITIPTATYYTSDGFMIDKQGVMPDIELKEEEDALEYVKTKLLAEYK